MNRFPISMLLILSSLPFRAKRADGTRFAISPARLRAATCAILWLLFFPSCNLSPGGTPEVPEGWTPLFDGESLERWQVTSFGGEGRVVVKNRAIILGMGNDLTGITYQGEFPRSDYEIYLEARRVRGNDFFCGLTFPVEDSFCTLILGGWGGVVVGLSSIDLMDAVDNETSTTYRFENDRWYEVRLRVESDRIQAWIDEERQVDFLIGDATLSVRPEVRLSRPLGIASWRTTAAIRDVRYRSLSSP